MQPSGKRKRILLIAQPVQLMRLLVAYCSWMECSINSRSKTSGEVMFEMANALSAMSKLLSVLVRIAAKTEGADTEDQCQPL